MPGICGAEEFEPYLQNINYVEEAWERLLQRLGVPSSRPTSKRKKSTGIVFPGKTINQGLHHICLVNQRVSEGTPTSEALLVFVKRNPQKRLTPEMDLEIMCVAELPMCSAIFFSGGPSWGCCFETQEAPLLYYCCWFGGIPGYLTMFKKNTVSKRINFTTSAKMKTNTQTYSNSDQQRIASATHILITEMVLWHRPSWVFWGVDRQVHLPRFLTKGKEGKRKGRRKNKEKNEQETNDMEKERKGRKARRTKQEKGNRDILECTAWSNINRV